MDEILGVAKPPPTKNPLEMIKWKKRNPSNFLTAN
jgi:hypothetical protein